MKEDFLNLCRNKLYVLSVSFTAVFGYGFLITHQTVGIDDTPYAYYFEEGLNVIVGRWLLFLINKVFRISDFTPFVTDLAGVILLMTAVTVWCTLLYSMCGKKVPLWGYVFFSCIFLSSPLIAEVYTYHLHNGVSIGYLCTGLSLYGFKELSEVKGNGKKMLAAGLRTSLFLVMALGCYESFMIVWLLGGFLVLLTKSYMEARPKVIYSLLGGALAAVASIVLRGIVIAVLIGIFGLGDMREEAVARSVSQMLGWLLEPGAFGTLAMAFKRVYVMYGVFAHAYYPIRIFVTAACIMVVCGLYDSIRRKNPWLIVLTFGCFIASFLLVVVEGKATLYRAAQFLPVICGYGAFLVVYAAERLKSKPFLAGRAKAVYGISAFFLCVVLWNQCFDMNRWFYVDWMKYQSAVDTAGQIANVLEQHYDTSKPVVFTGTFQPPKGIVGDAFVGYNTATFYRMKQWTDLVDEHLLEKFYREYGVWVAQTPALSVLDWGINAFGNDEELVRFFAMHGYQIIGNRDAELFEAALRCSIDWPGFPEEGSIQDMGDYIIVHF